MSTPEYSVRLIEAEYRFHNHGRNIVTNFSDLVELNQRVAEVQRGYREQHEKTAGACKTDGYNSIRHHMEKTAVVLPCLSLFVCLATLYVLSHYFKVG